MPYDAVVLAGGAARRLGGTDKAGVVVAGRTLLDIAVDACAGARRTIVVGPPRPTGRPVSWTREDPPGGGPVAGLAAALALAEAAFVVVLAVDHPFVTTEVVERLLAGLTHAAGADGCVLVDRGGHRQPLLAAYRRAALEARLAGTRARPAGAVAQRAPGAGVSMRRLLEGMSLAEVTAAGRDAADPAFDCDTWDDVHRARGNATGRMGHDGRARS